MALTTCPMSVRNERERIAAPVFLVGNRYQHHSRHSGYEGFRRYVGKSLSSPLDFRFLDSAWRVDTAISSLAHKPYYSLSMLLTEASAGLHMLAHRGSIYHLLYGDTDLRLLGRIGRLTGNRVIATFHETDEGLEWLQVDRRITEQIEAALLMSESQRSYFEQLMPPERIFVVQHGIDTDFFRPADEPTKEPVCITVGSKYRDFDVLTRALDIVLEARPDARFVAVGTHRNAEHPLRDPRAEYVIDATDELLLHTYRSARVAVCPLWRATANNALLEAMACGLPVVVTDVGGVREYVGAGVGVLCPECDAEVLAAGILRAFDDDRWAAQQSAAARARAERFDYRFVAAQMAAVYDAVLARGAGG
jgi:glycosyltransferase involved in cell wall biosynthesis